MTARTQIAPLELPDARMAENSSRGLYKAGGVAAAAVVALLVLETIAYLTTSAPSLADAEGWFRMFQARRLIALIDFGVLELFALVLFVPVFLALYAGLRRTSQAYAAIAGLLALAGIAADFGSNPLFSILTLSDAYAAAASEAARAQLVTVGQAILSRAALGGIGGSVEGGFPLAVAGLIFSVLMLRGKVLGRGAAVVGALANALGLAMYIWGAAAPTLAGSPFFGPFLLASAIWYGLVARSLLRLE